MEETFAVSLHFTVPCVSPNVWRLRDTDAMTHFGVDGGVGPHINSKQRLTTIHRWEVMGGALQWIGSRREMEAKLHTYILDTGMYAYT